MGSRKTALAKELSFLGGKHSERVRTAEGLLRAAGAAAAAEDGWPTDTAPVVTVIPDGDRWRLMVLRGRTDAVAWLVDADPALRTPTSGPAVVGAAFDAGDPHDLLAAVALVHGGHVIRAADLPGPATAALRIRGMTQGPGPTLATGWPPTAPCEAFCDRIVADTGPSEMAAAANGLLDDGDTEELLDRLAATVRRNATTDPDGFAALLTRCAEQAVGMDDWSPIGGTDRYGWSAADWTGGLSTHIMWPAVLLDAVDRAT